MNRSYKVELNRKILHLASLVIPIIIWYLPYRYGILFLLNLFYFVSIFEILRFQNNKIGHFITRFFSFLMRDSELNDTQNVTGSYMMTVSALLTLLIFPKNLTIIALSVLSIADTIAAYVGINYGQTEIVDNKTLEGTIAFFFTSLFVSIPLTLILCPFSLTMLFSAFVGSVCATIIEMMSNKIKIDDNLFIPIAYAFGTIITLSTLELII